MDNKYVVINKWTTSDSNSPGYMSGFEIGSVLYDLDQQNLSNVLESRGIDPIYFDLAIYQNYATSARAVRGIGEIQFFAKAEVNNSLRFSLLVYGSQEDDMFTDNTTDVIIQNMNAARTAYMQLFNLECETRKGYKDLDNDILTIMYENQTLTSDQAQSIFNSLL